MTISFHHPGLPVHRLVHYQLHLSLEAGFQTYDAGVGWLYRDQTTYTLRLVTNGQGNVEALRSTTQAAVAQIAAISGVQINVASGTIPDTSPDRLPALNEILLSVDDSTPCGAGHAGCGVIEDVEFDNDVNIVTVRSGRIWAYSAVLGYSATNQAHVVAHELGHVLGLYHFDSTFAGHIQVMNGTPAGYTAGGNYQSGDENGIEFLEPTPCIPTYLSSAESFTTASYVDFWQRNPTSTELFNWSYVIQHGTTCRADLSSALAYGGPYVGDLIDAAYNQVLERTADSSGRTSWLNVLEPQTQTTTDMYVGLAASNEFWTNSGSNNTGYVQALYTHLLGRSADPGGLAANVALLDSGASRAEVARNLYQALESRYSRVDALSTAFLDRILETAGRDLRAGELAADGDDIGLAVRLAASDEYFDRAVTRFP